MPTSRCVACRPWRRRVRDVVKIAEGRFFEPGLAELVVGRGVVGTIDGLALGSRPRFGGRQWTVVGVFDSNGSAFDSEIWCDARLLNESFDRPVEIFQSVTARLTSIAAFDGFKDALTSDPRLNVAGATRARVLREQIARSCRR